MEKRRNQLVCEFEQYFQASIESAKIRSVVDTLIGQVLAFVNVTLEVDKKPLTCMCQKVLRDTIAFEESSSLSKRQPDEQNRRLRAATLENAFYQLDRWINDSLLKLVFAVFVELKMDPIQQLRKLCDTGSGQDEIDRQVEKIDELFEKIVQIGNFALSFSWDYRSESLLACSDHHRNKKFLFFQQNLTFAAVWHRSSLLTRFSFPPFCRIHKSMPTFCKIIGTKSVPHWSSAFKISSTRKRSAVAFSKFSVLPSTVCLNRMIKTSSTRSYVIATCCISTSTSIPTNCRSEPSRRDRYTTTIFC